MFKPRTLGAGAILSLLTALALATTVAAAGNVPQGQGLFTNSEVGITSLQCTDPTIAEVIFPRGGVATWTPDGAKYLLQSIHVTGTVTTPEGTFPAEFSKTWGNRAGLAGEENVTCTFNQSGGGFEGTGIVTVVRVW